MLSHLQQVVVKGIDEDLFVALAKVVIEFALRLHHTLEAAEALQMGTTDIGDEPPVGLNDFTEVSYFTRMVGSCLYDGNIVFLWFYA